MEMDWIDMGQMIACQFKTSRQQITVKNLSYFWRSYFFVVYLRFDRESVFVNTVKRNISHRTTRFVDFNHLLVSLRLHHPFEKAVSFAILRFIKKSRELHFAQFPGTIPWNERVKGRWGDLLWFSEQRDERPRDCLQFLISVTLFRSNGNSSKCVKGNFARISMYPLARLTLRRPREINANCKQNARSQSSARLVSSCGRHRNPKKENSPCAFSRRALWSFMHSFNSSPSFRKVFVVFAREFSFPEDAKRALTMPSKYSLCKAI